ncbi:uncharacterized protein LOC143432226 [Xylocopa sonorina]|uniref:uncharacterized protein LOC143423837 n=1 Tax=Xylocopa sonorina TaxID=1818115 RepID=UPI00403AB7D4
MRRFYALEKKLQRQFGLPEECSKFMLECEKLGHMAQIVVSPTNRESAYYLPHHAVTKNSISLNDTHLIGPTIQNDLVLILIRFRCHKYVLSTDIEKMYRQILVSQQDRRLQQILWQSEPPASY